MTTLCSKIKSNFETTKRPKLQFPLSQTDHRFRIILDFILYLRREFQTDTLFTMKKIRCPRCDHYILFDETKYTEGQNIHLQCSSCGRKYNIRIGRKNDATPEPGNEGQQDYGLGGISVLENEYCYEQRFYFSPGDNIIGRRSKGTIVQIPIDSDDLTLARNHCVINVRSGKTGKTDYTLRDFPSRYGTFLNGTALNKNEQARLQNHDAIVLGSTTLIVHLPTGEDLSSD